MTPDPLGSLLLLPRRGLLLPRFFVTDWLWPELFESEVVGLDSDKTALDVTSDPAAGALFFPFRLAPCFLTLPLSWLCWLDSLPSSFVACRRFLVSNISSVQELELCEGIRSWKR